MKRALLALVAAACAARGSGDPDLPGLRGDPAVDATLGRALAARVAAGHQPRTRHRRADGSPRWTNRLILETSPYLLEHAHNPVSWYPWGDEAFARAAREGKPVLLSIGYAACHWCHVMADESFEDEEVARALNQGFVAIKVDREERPELDSVYLAAVELLGGHGGWPMTLVLTAGREPIFGGTYLRKGDLLAMLSDQRAAYGQAAAAAGSTARLLRDRARPAPAAADLPGPESLRAAFAELARAYDADFGGFGRGAKFPSAPALGLLLRYQRRSGDAKALAMVVQTLERMAAGGIHDQVGGGFHRYAVERRWIVPHFEKMLADNAQLAVLYLEAAQVTGRADFTAVARGILADVDRELSLPGGAFAGSLDADSAAPDGTLEEGRYYTFTPGEFTAALGAERGRAAAIYLGVTERGHVDGRSVLYASMPLDRAAGLAGLAPEAMRALVDESLPLLRAARARRPPPRRDDKAVTAWNGLAISAFARAALILGEPRYAARAARAAEAVLAVRPLPRSQPGVRAALLEDHAFLAAGLIDLFEATGDARWLAAARAEVATLVADFADGEGGFRRTARGEPEPLVRERPFEDDAEPSGNAVAALDLLRLHELTGDEALRARAEETLRAFASKLGGLRTAGLLAALDFALDTPPEIVLVSPAGAAPTALLGVVGRTYLPNRVLIVATEGGGPDLSLLDDKRALHGRPTAYVCRRRTCDLPTSDPAVLAAQLGRVTPL